jgi:hypothetical protein
MFHFHGDVVTITGGGLQNIGVCLEFMAIEKGEIFIVPHMLWHGASVFPVSSEGPLYSVASYEGVWRIYSNTDHYGYKIVKLTMCKT